LVLIIPIYQKGRYGKIDYERSAGQAGVVLLPKERVIVFSAEHSGAVQFFLSYVSVEMRI
jgi:hypothetical protein